MSRTRIPSELINTLVGPGVTDELSGVVSRNPVLEFRHPFTVTPDHARKKTIIGYVPSETLHGIYYVTDHRFAGGADPTGVADSTPAFQAAIDAAYAAGGGVVSAPAGTYLLGVSAAADVYWDGSVHRAPCNDAIGGCCLVMRDGVRLVGAGSGVTILRPVDQFPSVIYLVNGQDQSVEALQIHGKSTLGTTGEAHGILQVSTTTTPAEITGLRFRDIYVHEVGGYGIGLQSGDFRDVLFENIHTAITGADGIDIKNRGHSLDNKAITLRHITIESPGRRLDEQAGLDMGGVCHASDVTVTDLSAVGIRFRAASVDGPGAEGSTLTGFDVRGTGPGTGAGIGVEILSKECAVLGGRVRDLDYGIYIVDADDCTVSGVTALSCSVRGFQVDSSALRTKLSDCTTRDCFAGIRVSGDYVTITGNTVSGSLSHGVRLLNSVGTTVVGNTVTTTTDLWAAGIMVGGCMNFSVSGNTVSGSGWHGVALKDSVGGTVGNNIITANGGEGIWFDTCDDMTITGNIVSGNTGNGIQISGTTYCTVTGNRCKSNATPFVENGTSDYNMIAANNFLGNTSNACAVVGAHTQWSTGINGGTPDVASAATITLPKYTNYIVVTGTTNITSITAEPRDRMVTLRFSGILTVKDGDNLRLNGDLVTSASTTLTLQSSGTNWWEIARCVT